MVVKLEESQTATLTLKFFDDNGDPIKPNYGTYIIEDIKSGETVREETQFTPESTSHKINLTSDDTAVVDDTLTSEQRKILIDFYWDKVGSNDGHGVGKIYYLVVNRETGAG